MTGAEMRDPVDRLLLELLSQETEIRERASGPVAVVFESTGVLTATVLGSSPDVRLHQDSLAGSHPVETVLQRLATDRPELTRPRRLPLDRELFDGVRLVILRLPRPLEALEEVAWQAARWGADDVVLVGAERERHLNRSMNAELERHFTQVRASRGAHRSRALIATEPRHRAGSAQARLSAPPRLPRRGEAALELPTVGERIPVHLRAHGGTFGAARLDPGTRLLLQTVLDDPRRRTWLQGLDSVVDLGCGNGTVSAALALATGADGPRIHASDDSASAVRSTGHTLRANQVADRVQVVQDDGLGSLPDDCVDLVVLNPPFHRGTEVTTDLAHWLFEESARVLRPEGRLWCVWNSHLRYRPVLTRLLGPTEQLTRDRTFTVTESRRRG